MNETINLPMDTTSMKEKVHDEFAKMILKKHKSYVLITCDEPDIHGKINVDMSYDGDPDLIAFMIHGAQQYLEDTDEEQSISG